MEINLLYYDSILSEDNSFKIPYAHTRDYILNIERIKEREKKYKNILNFDFSKDTPKPLNKDYRRKNNNKNASEWYKPFLIN